MSTPPNENHSAKERFWETWQTTQVLDLSRDYSIQGYITDFAHPPTKTIIEIDRVAEGAIRVRLHNDGWRLMRVYQGRIERDVDGCVRSIVTYLTSQLNKMQPVEHKDISIVEPVKIAEISIEKPVEHQEVTIEKPVVPKEVTIVKTTVTVYTCKQCGRATSGRYELCYDCFLQGRTKPPQRKAIQWAKEMTKRDDLIIFDTETTGTNQWSEILEIAILDREGNILFDRLVKPKRGIPRESSEVHGITKEDVKDKLRFDEIWPEISHYFENGMVLAFNVAFDLRMLKQTAHRWKMTLPENIQHDCIMLKYASYQRAVNKGQSKSPSLLEACEQLGIQPGQHRALGDAQAAWGVLKKLSEME
jgi:DNA polymerase III epsilon subunit-like protein/very-short-patch-repair endonuclease